MTPDEAVSAICKRWIDTWPTLEPDVPFALPNTVIAQPSDGWVARVRLLHMDGEQHTLGGENNPRQWLYPGIIEVRISGPVGVGSRRHYELARKVRLVFQGRRIGRRRNDMGIVTHASSISELFRDPEAGQAFAISVATPFEYYERS